MNFLLVCLCMWVIYLLRRNNFHARNERKHNAEVLEKNKRISYLTDFIKSNAKIDAINQKQYNALRENYITLYELHHKNLVEIKHKNFNILQNFSKN